MCFLVVIPNDIWVVVCVFKETNFSMGEGNKVPKETFDGYCTPLQ